jgi:hypothetical protein
MSLIHDPDRVAPEADRRATTTRLRGALLGRQPMVLNGGCSDYPREPGDTLAGMLIPGACQPQTGLEGQSVAKIYG